MEQDLLNDEQLDTKPAKKTRLVSPQSNTVRLRVLRDIRVGNVEHRPGAEVEVSEEEAKEFLKPISGGYSFSGLRSDYDAVTSNLVRAERIA
jgi:hypothetical protein